MVKRLEHELDVVTYKWYNGTVETMQHGVKNNNQEEISNQYTLPIEQMKIVLDFKI